MTLSSFPSQVDNIPRPGAGTYEDDPSFYHDVLHDYTADAVAATQTTVLAQGSTIARLAATATTPTSLVINVKDATWAGGAKGDGTTDDNAAIVAADAAAASARNATVYFPPGTYRTSKPLVPSAGVTWAGASMWASIITVLPADYTNFGYRFIVEATHAQTTLRDFGVDGQFRNASSPPSNQCGGVTFGAADVLCERVRCDDSNYFGFYIGGGTVSLKMVDCRNARGNGGDRIGGGAGTNVRIVRHIWESTITGNCFDNVNGDDVVLSDCINYSNRNFYLEGMTRSGAVRCKMGTGNISIQSDSGYSPATVTNPYGCFARECQTNGGTIGISYYTAGTGPINKGGYNALVDNLVENATNPAGIYILGPNPASTSSLGGDRVVGNTVINPNVGGSATATWNTGSAVVHPGGITIANGLNVKVAGNTCIDTRGTPLMQWGITLSGASGGNATNCLVTDNHVVGSVTGDILADYNTTTTTILGNDTPHGVATSSTNGAAGADTVLARNRGANPLGKFSGQPAVPPSGSGYTNQVNNSYHVDCTVYLTGGTVTAVYIDGGAVATGAALTGGFRVPANKSITLAYSAAPTWVWYGD